MGHIRRGRKRNLVTAGPAVIERLSPRVLLSADLVGTTLVVNGTEANDLIIVGASKRFVNVLTVTYETGEQHFSLSEISAIEIHAGDGDDKIWIDSALDPLHWNSFIDGADGNDMITAAAGTDTILGGDGNDKIYGNAGADSIDAGAGRDSVWGGSDNDIVIGGAGNDLLVAEAGDDNVVSGKGNDYCDGGEGNDIFSDDGGAATIVGGAGNDSGRVAGTGIVDAGDGDDIFVSPGGALLYGQGGNDNLQGSWIDGGDGSDTLSGLLGKDEIHGGAGDDLIRGFAGRDVLLGDAGNDAIFGGGDNDTLYGGAGDDNLYGTDGYLDKRPDLAGNDDGFGNAGVDWFETGYRWNNTDRINTDRPVGGQNTLYVDPSYSVPQYVGGTFYSSETSRLTLTAGTTIANTIVSGGTISYLGDTTVGLNIHLVGITGNLVSGGIPDQVAIETQSLAPAGWLSSGAYDTASGKFVPPPMSHQQRMTAARVILNLPAGWNLGAISTARDDIVWYQLTRDGAPPTPAKPKVDIDLTHAVDGTLYGFTDTVNVKLAGGVFTVASGSYVYDAQQKTLVWGSLLRTPAPMTPADPQHAVPNLTGGSVNVGETTPHLVDGVYNGAYRFLGVKRGTILISGSGGALTSTGNSSDEPQWSAIDSPLLRIPRNEGLRIAGMARVFQTASTFDTLPTGGPKKLRGIAVIGGAIWLPNDGSEPYFSSGKS